ncbi:MAG: permease prefix domain 1-containing protein [Candidatus Hydrogenedentes bacterium]|nr:permease prefix domain 1-containing protein [Candidatus Hydrogenedentota bacterium]
MEPLRIHVERIVRPIRASQRRKNTMREELLAHLTQRAESAAAQGMNESEAIALAIANLGDPGELRAELQDSVPRIEQWLFVSLPRIGAMDRGFDRREGETTLHYATVTTLVCSIWILAATFIPVVIFNWDTWLNLALGASDNTGIVRFVLLPALLIVVVAIMVTFFAYLLADITGIRRALSKRTKVSLLRRSLAATLFINLYVSIFVVASAYLVSLALPNVNGMAPREMLALITGKLAIVWLAIQCVWIPFLAFAISKNHEQYELWERLEVDE